MNGANQDRDQPAADPARKTDRLLLALFALPLTIALARAPIFPTSALFTSLLSLGDLPPGLHKAVENVLFVPLGALVVVFFRLTLGIKVLGLFRPILMAMAFNVIGVPLGLAFLLFALLIIGGFRVALRSAHNYARIGALLSLVAALLFVPLIAGQWWHLAWLRELAYFPVIALCLTCESFAKVLDQEGAGEAARRTVWTVVTACITVIITSFSGMLEFFIRFPEFLLAQAGCILLINRYLAWRLFEKPALSHDASSAAPAMPPAEPARNQAGS